MGDNIKQGYNLSERERKRIAKELAKGYQKMASLNQKLAENGFVVEDGEHWDETR
ncbi:MAG: hypothetical protein ACQEQD_00735 [Bacillota bacterium]